MERIMNRTPRYEPVPQRDEVIILDSIHSPNYNFNTGIPNSVPSSQAPSLAPSHHAPSIRSIPNSPPPSFYTHSSPGTPRATPSAELWGVAPSSISLSDASGLSAPTEICAASDALSVIKTLQTRVDRLEETIGRLLLEKEACGPESNHPERTNCCVSYSDATSDLERTVAASGSNCCVRFSSNKGDWQKEKSRKRFVLAIVFLICVMIVSIVAVKSVTRCRGKGCEVVFGDD